MHLPALPAKKQHLCSYFYVLTVVQWSVAKCCSSTDVPVQECSLRYRNCNVITDYAQSLFLIKKE